MCIRDSLHTASIRNRFAGRPGGSQGAGHLGDPLRVHVTVEQGAVHRVHVPPVPQHGGQGGGVAVGGMVMLAHIAKGVKVAFAKDCKAVFLKQLNS